MIAVLCVHPLVDIDDTLKIFSLLRQWMFALVHYPDLVCQSHVDHVAERIADIRKDLMDSLPHGLEEKLVIGVKAPTG